MTHRFRATLYAFALTGAFCFSATLAPVKAADEAPLSPRIGATEYKSIIASVFGPDIVVAGRFEPEQRAGGLLALGARTASISADGFELYDNLARGIAAQVIDPQRRETLIHCKPHDASQSDDACARSFFSATSLSLFREPERDDELNAQVHIAANVANTKHDFYAGISAVLSQMLVSPRFLYRLNRTEADPADSTKVQLDGNSKASLLSFYLWGTSPDELLLKAAKNGELDTPDGLSKQVDRMIFSPNIEGGVRAFFSDMFGFDEFETLSKDANFFPHFTPKVVEQSKEQTLRTIVDHVVNNQGDYRDLFTTSKTFLTRPLAAVYGVPLTDKGDNGQPDRWISYTYAPDDPRAGILSEVSFVALHSPAGRTSPTLRGKALRELIMCQAVPPPPANVDFKFVQDTSNPIYKTTRDRLTAHRSEAMCAGCHKITDPMGLALENFDAAGGFRTKENGVKIDTSGEFSGVKFEGPVDLTKLIRKDPAITSCIARRSFAFASGHAPNAGDPAWQQIEKKFADSGYKVVDLMKQIAMSDLTYTYPASASISSSQSAK